MRVQDVNRGRGDSGDGRGGVRTSLCSGPLIRSEIGANGKYLFSTRRLGARLSIHWSKWGKVIAVVQAATLKINGDRSEYPKELVIVG